MENNDLYEQTVNARKAFWKKIGIVDPYVLSYFLNPALIGRCGWSFVRQAFVKVETPNTVILASDGLSNPFDALDEPNQGFSLECFIESDDPALRKSFADLTEAWQLQLLYNVVHHIAGHGGMKGVAGAAWSSFDGTVIHRCDRLFRDEEGRVGVLLGLDSIHIPPSIEGPASNIRLVSIKILTSRELQYVLRHGDAGRKTGPIVPRTRFRSFVHAQQKFSRIDVHRWAPWQGGGRQPAKEPTCRCVSARPLAEAIRGVFRWAFRGSNSTGEPGEDFSPRSVPSGEIWGFNDTPKGID